MSQEEIKQIVLQNDIKLYESRRRACPSCGGLSIVIANGLPAGNLIKLSHLGLVHLGGCLDSSTNTHICYSCSLRFKHVDPPHNLKSIVAAFS